ncbi:Uncharacterised protein [Legionella jordanis]|nr:Uncharacterised protein [Legionella jordanis]
MPLLFDIEGARDKKLGAWIGAKSGFRHSMHSGAKGP